VKSQYAGEIASAFYPLTDRYVGSWATLLMEILIVTGSFACTMSFYNTGARYLFALGREGVLPGALAHTSHRRSPTTASMTVTGTVAIYALAFTLYDPSTEGALLKLGTWSPLLGVLGILAVQALVSIAIIRFFLTSGRADFHWWTTLVAPLLGFAAMVVACVLARLLWVMPGRATLRMISGGMLVSGGFGPCARRVFAIAVRCWPCPVWSAPCRRISMARRCSI
jgi:amino acid transporter